MSPSLDDQARSRIKKWLASTGTTQTALAEKIGRTQAWMSRYLSGEFDADLETLQKIARVFGNNLTGLLDVPADPEEGTLLTAFRALPPDVRKLLLAFAAALTRPRGPELPPR